MKFCKQGKNIFLMALFLCSFNLYALNPQDANINPGQQVTPQDANSNPGQQVTPQDAQSNPGQQVTPQDSTKPGQQITPPDSTQQKQGISPQSGSSNQGIAPVGDSSKNTIKQTPIAQVIWVKGVVNAMQPGGPARKLERRSYVYEHDTITTTAGSTGELAFSDSSIVSLASASEVKVDQYQFKKTSSDKSVINIIKGGFRTITGSIPKENPGSYQINTPVATIGVRGTKFTALMSQTKGLLMSIDQGKIFVKNGSGTLELEHCASKAIGERCVSYGAVKSATSTPEPLSTPPTELTANQPDITPIPAGFAPGPNTPSNKGGSGFCIG